MKNFFEGMKLWRVLLNVVIVVLGVSAIVWYASTEPNATVFYATGIATVSSLGLALIGEFIGIVVGIDDFNKGSYFISVAVGAVFALVLSLIVL